MTENHKGLQCLLEKVYRERGFDFREYKESTLTRRLGRRLHARGVQTYGDYARILDRYPVEYDKLFDYLTINVTRFFHADVVFRVLEEIVLPEWIEDGKVCSALYRRLRIWSAGCATGEEPYSVGSKRSAAISHQTDIHS